MKKLCVTNTVLIGILIALVLTCIFVKYRRHILRFIRKKQVARFLINVVMPFLIPLILSMVNFGETWELKPPNEITGAVAFLLGIAVMNLIIQFVMWVKEQKEADIRFENLAAKYAYNSLFEIHKKKNVQLRNAHHNGLERGMLTAADVPYNIFDQIREITWGFGRAIAEITGIPTKDLDASFIYHYTYSDAGRNDKSWRWVTGKGSKFRADLNDFAETNDSTFHYMGNNNVATLFYNDKSVAHSLQRYLYSDKDHSHNCTGSIVAAKVAFSGNDEKLCEGIIMVNTYGQRFLDKSSRFTEDELRDLILDSILPCYKNLLTTELAMLYFQHQDEPDDSLSCKTAPRVRAGKKMRVHKSAFKCIVEATKKTWTKKRIPYRSE